MKAPVLLVVAFSCVVGLSAHATSFGRIGSANIASIDNKPAICLPACSAAGGWLVSENMGLIDDGLEEFAKVADPMPKPGLHFNPYEAAYRSTCLVVGNASLLKPLSRAIERRSTSPQPT